MSDVSVCQSKSGPKEKEDNPSVSVLPKTAKIFVHW